MLVSPHDIHYQPPQLLTRLQWEKFNMQEVPGSIPGQAHFFALFALFAMFLSFFLVCLCHLNYRVFFGNAQEVRIDIPQSRRLISRRPVSAAPSHNRRCRYFSNAHHTPPSKVPWTSFTQHNTQQISHTRDFWHKRFLAQRKKQISSKSTARHCS